MGDGFSDAPKTQSETLGFRGYFRVTDYSRITAEYHHIHEFRRGGDKLDRPPHETFATEQLRHYIDGGGLNYDLFSKNDKHKLSLYTSMQDIKRETYFGTFQDLDAYGSSKDISFVAGSQYGYSIEKLLFLPSLLVVGVEYTDNSLEDNMPSYQRFIDQYTQTIGSFFQNEWKNQLISLVVGGRLDKNNKIDNLIFSPRINLRYSPFSEVRFRAGWSSGYRAPQVFQEDLHIGAIGGEAALIEVDPNLKPEYSNSLNFSIETNKKFDKLETNLLIDFFYTNLKDVFVLEERGVAANGYLLFERTNAPGAVVQGVNIEFKTGITSRFAADFGFTFQRSRYKEPHEWSEDVPAGKIMLRSPDEYGYVSLNFFPFKSFTVSATGNYTGSMLYPHYEGYIEKDTENWTPTFFDAGLRLAYDFQITNQFNIQLSSGMKNIFDQFQKDIDRGPLRDATYIYGPTMPRMIYFGIKVAM
ncbi:MAG: TonB-dependent receptor [Marinilabiliaceae bacterium]|nr:TonB-dependent receptor [Marinilabiliaceae bacterium]